MAVLEVNHRAVRCYERCGFRLVGRVRGAALIDGEAHEDLVMEVQPKDFRR